MFTIAICDDEKAFGKQIERVIWQVEDKFQEKLEVVVFTSGDKLLEYMKQNTVDLLFLDIELGEMTGIQISRQIRKEDNNEQIQIVYITGKEGYERELFDFQPLNFLGKPLDEEKIKECVNMAYRKLIKGGRKFKYVSHYEERNVPINQIISFETEGKEIAVTLAWGKERFRSSMNKVENEVKGNGFLRISQSVIVNIAYIRQYDGDKVVMSDGKTYYVSRSKLKKVKQLYMEYILQQSI